MADTSKTLEIIISARDEATKVLKSFRQNMGDMAREATIGSAAIAGGIALVAKGIVGAASSMEQWKVSFDTMIGDSGKASKLLSELSDFAKKTPFDLPQVVEGSKRLLAYNIEAEKIIPTFTMLGNLAAGVGTDKLPQLILAFGQVKAATKLTGAELRQFSEAGIPLLEALVNQANEAGGVLTKVGGVSKDTAKKMGTLATKIASAEVEMAFFKKTGGKTDKQLQAMQKTIDLNKFKLGQFGEVGQAVYKRVKVSAEDMIGKISDGEVKFNDVQKALEGMTGEGGKFFDLMGKQSQTFSGRLSNMRDSLFRIAIGIAGISTEAETFGQIIEGSLFDKLSQGALTLMTAMEAATPHLIGFINAIVNNGPALATVLGALVGLMTPLVIAFVGMIAPALAFIAIGAALGAAIGLLVQGLRDGNPLAIGFTAALAALGAIILAVVIPAFISWAATAATAALATIVALWPIIAVVTAIGVVVGLFAAAWKYNWGNIREHTQNFTNWIKNTVMPFFQSEFGQKLVKIIDIISGGWITRFGFMRDAVMWVVDAIGNLINKAREMAEKVKGGLKIPGFQHGGFVPGGSGTAVPAILHGGERVIPRTGVDVNPGNGGGINLSLNFTGPVSMDSGDRVKELAQQVISMLGRQNELAAMGLI